MWRWAFLIFVFFCTASYGAVRINEILCVNETGEKDALGERSDWIELYNDGPSFSLAGWGLSDSQKNLFKWVFPETNFLAGTYLIVRADNLDRKISGEELHTNFKISSSGEYLGLCNPEGETVSAFSPRFPPQTADISYGFENHPVTEHGIIASAGSSVSVVVPGSAGLDEIWTDINLNEAGWLATRLPIGFQVGTATPDLSGLIKGNLRQAMYQKGTCAYLRKTFYCSNDWTGLKLKARYDDGFIAYLNGQEILSVNAPLFRGWNVRAATKHQAVAEEVFDLSPFSNLLRSGKNLLCIQALNTDTSDKTFFFDAALEGEKILRIEAGKEAFFAKPTFGKINGKSFLGFLDAPSGIPNSGFYENPISVLLEVADKKIKVRYTTDATDPTEENGETYTAPLEINKTTVLKVRSFLDGFIPSPIEARTLVFLDDTLSAEKGKTPGRLWPPPGTNSQHRFEYGLDERVTKNPKYAPLLKEAFKQIPSASLILPPGNLFDATTGIYLNSEHSGALWERVGRLQFFDFTGTEKFDVPLGVRLRGNGSRDPRNPKHSFRCFFRSEYGLPKFSYPLFGIGVQKFNHIDLRAEQGFSWSLPFGNDPREALYVRDELASDLQGALGHVFTRSRDCHLFLNGVYWGIYQFQEHPDDDFAASTMGGEEEDYDVIKTDIQLYTEISEGTAEAWRRLYSLSINGFTDTSFSEAVASGLLDPTNLADYIIINNFLAHADGPIAISETGVNNFIAFYNRKNPKGFKFLCHDTEASLSKQFVQWDFTKETKIGLNFSHFNPRFLHQALIKVPAYKKIFAARVFKHYFNDGIFTIPKIKEFFLERTEKIDLAIILEAARWGDVTSFFPSLNPYGKEEAWLPEINWVNKTFFPTRHELTLEQYRAASWIGPETPISTIPLPGSYNPGAAVEIKASAPVLYTTDGSNPRVSESAKLYTKPFGLWRPLNLRAAYAESDYEFFDFSGSFQTNSAPPLLVSEILSESSSPEAAFLELYNNSSAPLEISGLAITGSVNFVFAKTLPPLPPEGYLLLVKNKETFANCYTTNNLFIAGEYTGSLSNEGIIILPNGIVNYKEPADLPETYSIVAGDYTEALSETRFFISAEAYGSPGGPDLPEPLAIFFLPFILMLKKIKEIL